MESDEGLSLTISPMVARAASQHHMDPAFVETCVTSTDRSSCVRVHPDIDITAVSQSEVSSGGLTPVAPAFGTAPVAVPLLFLAGSRGDRMARA